jgi:hypothetical protein
LSINPIDEQNLLKFGILSSVIIFQLLNLKFKNNFSLVFRLIAYFFIIQESMQSTMKKIMTKQSTEEKNSPHSPPFSSKSLEFISTMNQNSSEEKKMNLSEK